MQLQEYLTLLSAGYSGRPGMHMFMQPIFGCNICFPILKGYQLRIRRVFSTKQTYGRKVYILLQLHLNVMARFRLHKSIAEALDMMDIKYLHTMQGVRRYTDAGKFVRGCFDMLPLPGYQPPNMLANSYHNSLSGQ